VTDAADAASAAAERLLGALGGRAVEHAPLGARTTYRVGGAARVLVEAASIEDLQAAAAAVRATGAPVLVVGRGSNLLVADDGVDAVVVVLGEAFAGVEVDGTSVTAGGAALLPVVARRTAAEGLTGFEWAVGVPGSIGGAVRMNAGGHGSEMAAALRGVRVFDLQTGDDGAMATADLDLGYRRSSLRAHQVVLSAELELQRGDRVAAETAIAEIVTWRREHQPGGANAGSVFTNPPGDSAGRLIDAAGLRGLRIGTAAVSEKHANFIQADDGGRATDVVALMAEVRRRVEDDTGVLLEVETKFAGFDPTPFAERA
jgi:UDP-N-acetylmuramate dehydrogenase